MDEYIWMSCQTQEEGEEEKISKQLPSGRSSSAFCFLYHHPSLLNESQPAGPPAKTIYLMQHTCCLLRATYDTIQQKQQQRTVSRHL